MHESGNAVLFIEACIHPGESEGKDAGLMLIRDIIIHEKYPELLENTTLLFIPIFNTDGHERFSAYNRINQKGEKLLNNLNQFFAEEKLSIIAKGYKSIIMLNAM